MSQKPDTRYQCSVCGATVKFAVSGDALRACGHDGAPIAALMAATARGKASVQKQSVFGRLLDAMNALAGKAT